MKKPDFAQYLSNYLIDYLPNQLGASINTIKSYRDSFKTLLIYSKDELKIMPDKLILDMFTHSLVTNYLFWLEEKRGCSISTRNHRLAVIHAFFRYVVYENPQYLNLYTELLSIKPKRAPKKSIDYLSIKELKMIFLMPKTNTVKGKRDLAILSLLYDSGARVQELIDLKYHDLRLDIPTTIKLTGKGNKARIVPLMPDTTNIIKMYTGASLDTNSEQYLFVNRSNTKLSRSGIEYIIKKYVKQASEVNTQLLRKNVTPHIFRHSKAMHLVQANVNIIYIRDLLGHVSVQTTEVYAKADSSSKRRALEEASKNIVPVTKFTEEKTYELLDWLNSIK